MKNVLLHTYTHDLENAQRQASQSEKSLNSYIASIEQLTSLKLSDTDKLEVKENALKYLEKTLNFSLPNAPESLKYESIGIDIYKIKKLDTISWKRFNFHQDADGNFILDEIQPTYEAYRKYANEKQLKILEETKELCHSLNKALSQGLNSGNIVKISEVFKTIKINNSTIQFEPCLQTISHLR